MGGCRKESGRTKVMRDMIGERHNGEGGSVNG